MAGTLAQISKFFIDFIYSLDTEARLLDIYVVDPEAIPETFPVCTLDFVPVTVYDHDVPLEVYRLQVKFWFGRDDFDYITQLVESLQQSAGWYWRVIDTDSSICYRVVRTPFTGSESDLRSITVMLEVFYIPGSC